MDLKDYFEQTQGHGILATANNEGKVNTAVYARPYFADDDTAVFIMAEKVTHQYLQTNPWASYIFIESGEGYSGIRIY